MAHPLFIFTKSVTSRGMIYKVVVLTMKERTSSYIEFVYQKIFHIILKRTETKGVGNACFSGASKIILKWTKSYCFIPTSYLLFFSISTTIHLV